jgi:hypothetical protein
MRTQLRFGVVLTAALSSLSFADDRSDAKQACAEVMVRAERKVTPTDVSALCEITPHSAAVWRCTQQRMEQSQPFTHALESCKNSQRVADPS